MAGQHIYHRNPFIRTETQKDMWLNKCNQHRGNFLVTGVLHSILIRANPNNRDCMVYDFEEITDCLIEYLRYIARERKVGPVIRTRASDGLYPVFGSFVDIRDHDQILEDIFLHMLPVTSADFEEESEDEAIGLDPTD